MKPWIKRSLIGVAVTATLLGGFAASAHREHGHQLDTMTGWKAVTAAETAPLQGRLIERAARKPDLDVAQKAKLAALAERLRETRNAMMANSVSPREAFQAAIAGPRFDRGRVDTLVQAQLATAGAQSPALINAAADFCDSLRPGQQAELRELLARRDEDRKHGPGVADDQLARLSEPFHRPDAARTRSAGGVGLGAWDRAWRWRWCGRRSGWCSGLDRLAWRPGHHELLGVWLYPRERRVSVPTPHRSIATHGEAKSSRCSSVLRPGPVRGGKLDTVPRARSIRRRSARWNSRFQRSDSGNFSTSTGCAGARTLTWPVS